jgi:DNA uptake protein ComE-like DNA-binding protein
MSTVPYTLFTDEEVALASDRDGMGWNWSPAARSLLSVIVIASALSLVWASHSVPESGEAIAQVPDFTLDLNTAPPSVLGMLPHVGPALTRQIVAARELGPLTSLEDVRSRVRGFGPSTLAQIAPYVRFEGSGQLRAGSLMRVSAVGSPLPSPAAKSKKKRTRKPKAVTVEPRLVSREPVQGAL